MKKELETLNKKLRDERNNFEKEKLVYQTEIEKLKQQNSLVVQDFDKFKKDQAHSPVEMIKNELAKKKQEILDL